jgi:hypothetical protein
MKNQIVFTSRSLGFEKMGVSVEPLEKEPKNEPFVEWIEGLSCVAAFLVCLFCDNLVRMCGE